MTQDKDAFLSRWSRLKREQAAKEQTPAPPAAKAEAPPALPPLDKLTPESDFTAFMHPKVEKLVRRAALKKLFGDPHFNVPDPFEAYSGDWTGGEPISEEMLKTLNQARSLLSREPGAPPAEPGAEPPRVADAETAADTANPRPEPRPDEPGRQDA